MNGAAMNGASAGRNIGLSLGVFVYAILIMGRKCREMSGWDSLMISGLNFDIAALRIFIIGRRTIFMSLHLVFKLWWLHYPRGWILFCYTSTSLLKIKKK